MKRSYLKPKRNYRLMNAFSALEQLGEKLVGKSIITEAIGAWPGGKVRVERVGDSQEVEDGIVFICRHPTWKDDHGDSLCGVFETETVGVPVNLLP